MSVIALAEKGALFDPGPCMYMEKLAVGPSVNPHMVSLLYPIERNLKVGFQRSAVMPRHRSPILHLRYFSGQNLMLLLQCGLRQSLTLTFVHQHS